MKKPVNLISDVFTHATRLMKKDLAARPAPNKAAHQPSAHSPLPWTTDYVQKMYDVGAWSAIATARNMDIERQAFCMAAEVEKLYDARKSTQKWGQLAGERQNAIETLQGELDHVRNNADKLAEAINKAQDRLYFASDGKMTRETLVEFCHSVRCELNEALSAYEAAQS